jgi:hypothetical protein
MHKVTHSNEIDRKSFILGMVTAFAECVANECKKLALSPPFYPDDHEAVRSQAEEIAREQQIYLWYDENKDIPVKVRLNWFVIYKFPEVLAEYQRIRKMGHNPAWDIDAFSALLSYGTAWAKGSEAIGPQLREKRPTQDTFSRFLLKAGDWPIRREKSSPK